MRKLAAVPVSVSEKRAQRRVNERRRRKARRVASTSGVTPAVPEKAPERRSWVIANMPEVHKPGGLTILFDTPLRITIDRM